MLVYLALAPELYARFILKNANPLLEEELPVARQRISFWVEGMNSATLQGKQLYQLWGWAFLREEPDQSQYERFILLESDAGNYIFSTEPHERPDVQKAFPDLNINLLNSGFSAFISQDMLPRGTFQIGILFKDVSGDAVSYVITQNRIVRTANRLLLETDN